MVASVSNITSASSTVRYFEKDGYYSKDDPEHRKASHWVGQGAELLGLAGHVDAAQFRSVLEGYIPQTDVRLGRIRDGEHEHRAGVDVTLSAPKSVSLEALVQRDERVQDAHDAAMRMTLDFVERRIVQTRVWNRAERKMKRVYAPAAVVATFRHVTSRNLDPQLHTHCVIANMTRDTNGKWRSIETGDLKRNQKLIGAFYRNELARRLRQLGFALAPSMVGRVPGFELAGRDRVALQTFSSRRRDMLDYIAERGWEYNAGRAQQAALATRPRKNEPRREVLTTLWRQRAEEAGVEKTDRENVRDTTPAQSPLEIVWQAAEKLEEQPPVFAQRDLTTLALGHAAGRHTLTDMDGATERMRADGHLIAGIRRGIGASFVTDRTLRAQEETVAGMLEGMGAAMPLAPADRVQARTADCRLTESQREAIRVILSSRDRVVAVQVYAAMGKTGMLRQLVALAEGRLIIGLAPSASAARQLARETGITCRTLQGFLERHRDVVDNLVGEEQLDGLRKDFAGSILVVDGMAQVSTEQARRLTRIANQLGIGRLALIGDRRQLRAISAGQPFRQLREAGMQTALMDDIRRQRNPGLKATTLDVIGNEERPIAGRPGENLYPVAADRLGETAAHIWLELLPAARARTAIVASTPELRQRINEDVREGLAEEGVLHGRELAVETLIDLGLTQAQKDNMDNWREGDSIVFHNDLARSRIQAGAICTVTAIENGQARLHHADDGLRHITPADAVRCHLDVCATNRIRIRAGDRIRWTRNDDDRGLARFEQAAILAIDHHIVQLRTDDGRMLEIDQDDLQLRHIEHAYAASLQAARRLEQEDLIAALDSGHGRLSDQRAFCSRVGRGRGNAVILTDNREQLIELLQENTSERHNQPTRKPDISRDADMDMGL